MPVGGPWAGLKGERGKQVGEPCNYELTEEEEGEEGIGEKKEREGRVRGSERGKKKRQWQGEGDRE